MPSILIVENDYVLGHELKETVIEAGHEVVGVAPDYNAALRIAESTRPDLALVDYKLNGSRDGVTVAHQLRKLGTKVIYVTASADEVRLVDGISEILPKPFTDYQLLRAIERVIASATRHD